MRFRDGHLEHPALILPKTAAIAVRCLCWCCGRPASRWSGARCRRSRARHELLPVLLRSAGRGSRGQFVLGRRQGRGLRRAHRPDRMPLGLRIQPTLKASRGDDSFGGDSITAVIVADAIIAVIFSDRGLELK